MLKKLIAILLILIGILGVAAGVWGLSMQADSEIDPAVAEVALKVLQGTDDVVGKIDGTVSEWTNGGFTLTSLLNDLTGDSVDLSSDTSITWFVYWNALEILLVGIILMQTGLLIFAWSRK